ncbi:P-loop containing nucleoside triphosphate hydrolase protein [Auricularia subglabra TFB-10046 SS5]|nr:P-loop containing nucleoside triphosphate hydrolase protein [Auricularia subglabra TFB-10046 SS5]
MSSQGQDAARPAQLEARRYQEEIFVAAQQGNIIAVLDTGSGKTFIAVQLIKWVTAQPCPERKVVVFLAPKRPLVMQQALFIQSQVPLNTQYYLGDMTVDDKKVELWDREQWRKEFTKRDVLVMTPQILLDLLTHAHWQMSKISLLVFDEAHHAQGKHPYSQILKQFVSTLPVGKRPKIFGMTASPTWDAKRAQKQLDALESTMNARIIAVKEHQVELSKHVSRPKELVYLYQSYDPSRRETYGLDDTEAAALEDAPLSPGDVPTVPGVWDVLSPLLEKDVPDFSKLKTRRDVLLDSLGPYAAELFAHRYFTALAGKLLDAARKAAISATAKSLARVKRLEDLHARLAAFLSGFVPGEIPDALVSPKLRLLGDVLCENHDEHFKCVIFVEQKHIAMTLAELLPRLSELDWVSPAALIGHSTTGETDIGGMDSKQQAEVVKGFRASKYNVLLATSVAEEGLDFQACHLVIRFDGLQNLISYVQSRGRARHANSTYVVLLPRDDPLALTKYEGMRDAEPLLREQYAAFTAAESVEPLDTDEPSAADLALQQQYVVPSTGATLTYDTAIPLLELLCASAPSDQYGVLRPSYTVEELGEQAFRAAVALPPALPLPRAALRFDSGDEPRKSKREARRAAAFAAVAELHSLGVFDDHLLPVNYKRDKLGEDAYGRKSEDTSDVPEHMTVDVVLPWKPIRDQMWVHRYYVDGALAAGFVTGTRVPDVEFSADGRRYSLGDALCVETEPGSLTLFAECTKTLLRLCGVFMRRCDSPLAFYLAFLGVDGRPDLEAMRNFVQNPTSRDWESLAAASTEEVLVVNRIRLGHLYVLVNQHTGLTVDDKPVEVDGTCREAGFASYMAYYQDLFEGQKYTLHLEAASPMFCCRQLPRLETSSYDISAVTGLAHVGERGKPVAMRMVPQSVCYRLCLSSITADAVRYLPQLTRRLCDVARATALDLPGIELNALIEATTLPPAMMGFDNQRLETLGDAFLKLGVSVYAFHAFPFKHEGQLTNVRIPSISNKSLLARARAFNLQRYLSVEVSSRRKWSPRLTNGKVEMPRRSMQECVEALLGAAFASGGVPCALAVGGKLGLCFGPPDKLWTERYVKPVPSPLRRPLLHELQQRLGHEFANETLLLEAVTHRSMQSSETPSYERLEFLGDALLDMAVMQYLFKKYPQATCGQLSWARQRAVCNSTLAWIAATRLHVHECLLQNHIELAKVIDAARQELIEMSAEQVIRDGWKMDMPKPPGDLVEAVFAAMFIDMGHDYERAAARICAVIRDVLVLLSPDMPRDPSTELMLYIGRYGCMQVKYRKSASDPDGGRNDSMTVVVHDIEVIRPVQAQSLLMAKAYAAAAAKTVLEDEDSPFHMLHLCTCMHVDRKKGKARDDVDKPHVEQGNDETEVGFDTTVQQKLAEEGEPLVLVGPDPDPGELTE